MQFHRDYFFDDEISIHSDAFDSYNTAYMFFPLKEVTATPKTILCLGFYNKKST